MIRDLARVAQRRAKRLPLHLAIRSLVGWQPLLNPSPGYTLVVGCMHELAPLALANLSLLAAMDQRDLREVVLVFDCVPAELPGEVRRAVSRWEGPAELRVLCYSPRQSRVARRIYWGWVYAWLSWSIGIGAARTRHVLLHDLDALPLDRQLFQTLYRRALASGAQFQGIQAYRGNGVDPSWGLATTFELVLDAQYVRAEFEPLDGFNHVALVEGSYVDFDTLLHMQFRSPRRAVEGIDPSQWVHPSQLICQFTDFTRGRRSLREEDHNLLLLPYFELLGGQPEALRRVAGQLRAGGQSVELWGRSLAVGQLSAPHWAWLEKQVRRVEQHLYGATRPEVADYLSSFAERAGAARTVGVEPESAGGVPDR